MLSNTHITSGKCGKRQVVPNGFRNFAMYLNNTNYSSI